jgi:hypothetical protein
LSCAEIFQDIIDNIEKNKEKWDNYLNEEITKDNMSNNYYLNNLILPDKDLESYIDPLVKFIFFSIIKPNKKEFLINIFFKNTIHKMEEPSKIKNEIKVNINDTNKLDSESEKDYDIEYKKIEENKQNNILKSMKVTEKIEDYDLIKAFKNFSLKKDYALVLMAPKNNISLYDNILYNHCYLKMFNNAIDKNQQGGGLNNSTANGPNPNEHINKNGNECSKRISSRSKHNK